MKEIEEQSANAARELLLEAEQLKAKNTKKSKMTTKKKETSLSQSTHTCTSSSEKEDDAWKDDDKHMALPPCAPESKSLLALFLWKLQSTSLDEDDADELGSWMEVTKKAKKPVVALVASTLVEESKSFEDEDKEEDNIQPSYYVAPSLPTLGRNWQQVQG